jgi:hypothetical protein
MNSIEMAGLDELLLSREIRLWNASSLMFEGREIELAKTLFFTKC